MSTPQLGVVVDVYVGPEGSRSTGISGPHSQLTVVGVLDETMPATYRALAWTASDRVVPMPAQLQISEPTSAAPAVWLRLRFTNAAGSFAVIEPITGDGEPRPFTYGGCWAECDDPIWLQLTDGTGTVRINDRVES